MASSSARGRSADATPGVCVSTARRPGSSDSWSTSSSRSANASPVRPVHRRACSGRSRRGLPALPASDESPVALPALPASDLCLVALPAVVPSASDVDLVALPALPAVAPPALLANDESRRKWRPTMTSASSTRRAPITAWEGDRGSVSISIGLKSEPGGLPAFNRPWGDGRAAAGHIQRHGRPCQARERLPSCAALRDRSNPR